MVLGPGTLAPEFELPDQEGRPLRLSDLRGHNVVLFFYPKDDTPGCTRESCDFRDRYADLRAAGAEVLGISSDDTASHARFAGKLGLPYRLLSDRGRSVAQAFGVPQRWGLLPARVTFVIDRGGVIRHALHSDFDPTRHVREALEALARLEAARGPAQT